MINKLVLLPTGTQVRLSYSCSECIKKPDPYSCCHFADFIAPVPLASDYNRPFFLIKELQNQNQKPDLSAAQLQVVKNTSDITNFTPDYQQCPKCPTTGNSNFLCHQPCCSPSVRTLFIKGFVPLRLCHLKKRVSLDTVDPIPYTGSDNQVMAYRLWHFQNNRSQYATDASDLDIVKRTLKRDTQLKLHQRRLDPLFQKKYEERTSLIMRGEVLRRGNAMVLTPPDEAITVTRSAGVMRHQHSQGPRLRGVCLRGHRDEYQRQQTTSTAVPQPQEILAQLYPLTMPEPNETTVDPATVRWVDDAIEHLRSHARAHSQAQSTARQVRHSGHNRR